MANSVVVGNEPFAAELQDILNMLSAEFSRIDYSEIKLDMQHYPPTQKNGETWHTSKEYLDIVKDLDHAGYPEQSMMVESSRIGREHRLNRITEETSNRIKNYFSLDMHNALSAYYPVNGYLAWHSNWNSSGYNIAFTWSPVGAKGYFRYYIPEQDKIVTVPDPEGWHCKISKFPSIKSWNSQVWHCAEALEGPRFTYSFTFKDKRDQDTALRCLYD